MAFRNALQAIRGGKGRVAAEVERWDGPKGDDRIDHGQDLGRVDPVGVLRRVELDDRHPPLAHAATDQRLRALRTLGSGVDPAARYDPFREATGQVRDIAIGRRQGRVVAFEIARIDRHGRVLPSDRHVDAAHVELGDELLAADQPAVEIVRRAGEPLAERQAMARRIGWVRIAVDHHLVANAGEQTDPGLDPACGRLPEHHRRCGIGAQAARRLPPPRRSSRSANRVES